MAIKVDPMGPGTSRSRKMNRRRAFNIKRRTRGRSWWAITAGWHARKPSYT